MYRLDYPRFAILTIVLMLAAACAFSPTSSENDQAQAPGWTLVPSAGHSDVVIQRQVASGFASINCDEDGCRTLIATEAACEINQYFPILINTKVETGITEGQCLPISPEAQSAGSLNVILLTEPNVLLPYMILGDDVTAAVPMINGEVRIFTIAMNGVRELIAPLKPDLFESPAWLNNHGLIPSPDPDTLDEDEVILWRRGLLGI